MKKRSRFDYITRRYGGYKEVICNGPTEKKFVLTIGVRDNKLKKGLLGKPDSPFNLT